MYKKKPPGLTGRVKYDDRLVNRPYQVVQYISEIFGSIDNPSSFSMQPTSLPSGTMIKYPRALHGSMVVNREFMPKRYRYFRNFVQEMVGRKELEGVVGGGDIT